jgi:hypothetical protein
MFGTPLFLRALYDDERSFLSPSFFAGFQTTLPVVQDQRDGSFAMRMTFLTASACPARVRVGGQLTVSPCVLGEVGVVRADAFRTPAPAHARSQWIAGGAQLRAELALPAHLLLGADLAIKLPSDRARFYFQPNDTAHEVAAVALAFGVGLAARF